MYVAVSRKNQNGRTYNPEQKISRVAGNQRSETQTGSTRGKRVYVDWRPGAEL